MGSSQTLTAAGSGKEIRTDRWSRLLVSRSYLAILVNLVVLALVWYLYERPKSEASSLQYWFWYIILPSSAMLVMTVVAEIIVKSARVSLRMKQVTSLVLVLVFCAFLCFVHNDTASLLAAFLIPVLLSAVYADVALSRATFLAAALLQGLSGLYMRYYSPRGGFEGFIFIELIAAFGLLLASYVLSKLLILYGIDAVSAHSENATLEQQLDLDPLTDLYNRRALNKFMPQILGESVAKGLHFSAAEIDVDDFKRINDLYGHPAGDRVLVRLADVIRDKAPGNVFAFRFGGEKFMLLFKGFDAEEAARVCGELLEDIRSARIPEVEFTQVTASCGVAAMDPQGGLDSPAELFHAADTAMNEAKRAGKNRVAVYGEGLPEAARAEPGPDGPAPAGAWPAAAPASLTVDENLLFQRPGFWRFRINRVFSALRDYATRSGVPFALVYLAGEARGRADGPALEGELDEFLQSRIGPDDLMFKLAGEMQWVLFMPRSGEKDGVVFARRLFGGLGSEGAPSQGPEGAVFSSFVAEISDTDQTLESILQNGIRALAKRRDGAPWHVEVLHGYKKGRFRTVDVSILEGNDVFRNLLTATVESIASDRFALRVRGYADGSEFLNSDWYLSENAHIIIASDVLPRQNGFDVLHRVRALQGRQPVLFYMTTESRSEESIVSGFRAGADQYLYKPLNLRLFEAELRRDLERMQ